MHSLVVFNTTEPDQGCKRLDQQSGSFNLRLQDHKKTSDGGSVLLLKASILYPFNYPSKHTQDHIVRTETDENILKAIEYFVQMVDVPEYFCRYISSQHN